MYIQLTSRSVGALIKFSVTGTGVSEVPPDPVPPGPPGSPPATPPGTPPDTITTTKKKSNLALIIGIAVGVIGFIAIIGFLVYYIMRQKRLMSERLAEEEEEEDEDEDAVQSFKQARRGPASKKRNIKRDELSEEEEESEEPEEELEEEPKKPLPKKKLQKINNAPVHPYQDGSEDEDEGVNPY